MFLINRCEIFKMEAEEDGEWVETVSTEKPEVSQKYDYPQ